MLGHSKFDTDAYKRPSFSFLDKVRRLIWQFSWFLLCRWTPKPLHRWRSIVLRCFGATIGNTNFIYPDCKIWAPWLLVTEDVVTIGPNVEIYNPGGVFLKHHSILSQDAYLCGATHDYNVIEFTYIKKPIIVGAYAWVCAKAIVLPGVTLGDGSVLGAASLASKDLNPWSVYAGNPMQYIKTRPQFLTNK